MRFSPKVELFRIRNTDYASNPGDDYGAFIITGPCGRDLMVIASPGDAHESIPWEHVSVSLKNRPPNWEEMCYIKSLFWDDEETVMQLHPPKSQWINNHPNCLHLWRPIEIPIPLPPSVTVGSQEIGTLDPHKPIPKQAQAIIDKILD
jgi:hypothetical protein